VDFEPKTTEMKAPVTPMILCTEDIF